MDSLSTLVSLSLLIALSSISGAAAAIFTVRNNCPYTVWAAATPVGGGRQLNRGDVWTVNVPTGTASGRVWGRTGCSFDGAGRGRCQTADCAGDLVCRLSGEKPLTIAEFTLQRNYDSYDISLVDGFNVPMEFRGESGGCNKTPLRCAVDINSQCPAELRGPSGGCRDGCTVFNQCGESTYSRFFKDRCPDAYSYAGDNSATHSCPAGTNYNVVFCP